MFATTKKPYPVEENTLNDVDGLSPFSTCTLTNTDGTERTVMHAGDDYGINDLVFAKYRIPRSTNDDTEHVAIELEVRSDVNNWVVMGSDLDEKYRFVLDGFLADDQTNPLNVVVKGCAQVTKWVSVFQTRTSGLAKDNRSYEIRSLCADGTLYELERFRLIGDGDMIAEQFMGRGKRPAYLYCVK
jgi:hypothetical protein